MLTNTVPWLVFLTTRNTKTAGEKFCTVPFSAWKLLFYLEEIYREKRAYEKSSVPFDMPADTSFGRLSLWQALIILESKNIMFKIRCIISWVISSPELSGRSDENIWKFIMVYTKEDIIYTKATKLPSRDLWICKIVLIAGAELSTCWVCTRGDQMGALTWWMVKFDYWTW